MLTDVPLSLQQTDAQQLIDPLIEQIHHAMQHANNNCRKIQEGEQAFSPPQTYSNSTQVLQTVLPSTAPSIHEPPQILTTAIYQVSPL